MNMRLLASGAALLACLLGSGTTLAGDTTIQISPRVGFATVRLDADRTLSHVREDRDALSLGVTLGVVTPVDLLIEGGLATDATVTLFGLNDRYELSQYTLAVGYQFESDNGLRLIPKAGRSRWRLYDKEGRLANPGPEEEHSIDGYEYFWELTLQQRIRKSSAIGVTFRDNSFVFGSARSIVFTMTFGM